MNLKKIRLHISTARIDRYLVATGQNVSKAQRLYKANLKVAQSFYPLLNTLEVVIRNGLNTILSGYFGDFDWIINQKSGFMSHPLLRHKNKKTGKIVVNTFLKAQVIKAENKIAKNRMTVTSGKVIAEQTLGFWTDFFEVHHYKILKGRPIKVFQNLPVGHGRKEVCDILNDIRFFRNRIYHNEPIIFKGGIIDLQVCEDVHEEILNVLSWIDPDLNKWVKDMDSVEVKIKNAKTIK